MQRSRRRKTTRNLVGGEIQTSDGSGMKSLEGGGGSCAFKIALNLDPVVVAAIPYHRKVLKSLT
jgi:hypothetical protein